MSEVCRWLTQALLLSNSKINNKRGRNVKNVQNIDWFGILICASRLEMSNNLGSNKKENTGFLQARTKNISTWKHK